MTSVPTSQNFSIIWLFFRKKAIRPSFTEKGRMCTGDASFYKMKHTGKQVSTQGGKEQQEQQRLANHHSL
jgi:hypothetical protein